MNNQNIFLDLDKDFNNTCVTIAQGDSGGITLIAQIYDNGQKVDLTGYTVCLVALLPDRRHYVRQLCDTDSQTATVVINENEMASVPGYTDEAYFTLTKDGNTYSTARFALDIKRSALIDKAPAESWDGAVQDLVTKTSKAIDDCNATTAEIMRMANTGEIIGLTPIKEQAALAESTANDALQQSGVAVSKADSAFTTAQAAAIDAAKINSIATWPVELLSGNGWTGWKMSDGTSMLFGTFTTQSMVINKQFGSKFNGEAYQAPDYPSGAFNAPPTYVIKSGASAADGKPTDGETVIGGTATTPPRVVPLYVRAEREAYTYDVNYMLCGRWK